MCGNSVQKKLRKEFNSVFEGKFENPAEYLDDLLLLSSAAEIAEACVEWGCDPEPAAKLAQLVMR